jgi:hypothetical protein
VSTKANANGRVQDVPPEPVHLAALSERSTQADKIRYACAQNRPNPTTATVRDWLTRHGVDTRRPYASTVVNAWRKERGLSDTGDLPALSADLLAELDADRDRVQNASTVDAHASIALVQHAPEQHERPAGARGFYAVAVLSLLVSVDTSWRFFGIKLGITASLERVALFTVMEAALIACGFAMRAGVQQSGRPGPARLVAWALAAFAGFAAISLSGPIAGTARVVLGPLLGLVMLHLALGIEIRSQRARMTTWARIGREIRERLLSRLGLADDTRDALARTRDRAARRVARLALASKWTPFRKARLRRALNAANIAETVAQGSGPLALMLAALSTEKHADRLRDLNVPSPW